MERSPVHRTGCAFSRLKDTWGALPLTIDLESWLGQILAPHERRQSYRHVPAHMDRESHCLQLREESVSRVPPLHVEWQDMQAQVF